MISAWLERWGRSLARDDDGLQKQATKYGFADSPTVRMKKFWSGQQKEKPVGRRFNSCRPHQDLFLSGKDEPNLALFLLFNLLD